MTLLASAGVEGLVVALAAQDTLKNLFGTLIPFRVTYWATDWARFVGTSATDSSYDE